MKTSPEGIAVMHAFEGCVLRAYPDPATGGAPWTIGWGDTGPDVKPGLVITQQQADDRFLRRLALEFEPGINDVLQNHPTQNQFDAFVSLAYNIGLPNFRASTALRKFNLGDTEAAGASILLWNKAAGKVMLGLKRRRLAEWELFKGKPAVQAIAIGRALQA